MKLCNLLEMPHVEYPDFKYQLVDFRVERSTTISKEEKQRLIHSFNSGKGFIGNGEITSGKFILFTPDFFREATEEEINTIPKLPSDWENILFGE